MFYDFDLKSKRGRPGSSIYETIGFLRKSQPNEGSRTCGDLGLEDVYVTNKCDVSIEIQDRRSVRSSYWK